MLLSTCDADDDRFVFVHGDIFPRNILVSNSDPPTVTGIIDFEFSGFLPPSEEFEQDLSADRDVADWPVEIYQMLVDELEDAGVITPRSLSHGYRKTLQELHRLAGPRLALARGRRKCISSGRCASDYAS